MQQALIVKFEKYQQEIKESIEEYIDLVSDDFIPDFFETRESILELIIENLNEVFYCKDIRSHSGYTFSNKRLVIGRYYTKATLIHEIHHIIQSSLYFKFLKSVLKDKTDKELINIVDRHYLDYSYFFEGLAIYWEIKYAKKYQVKHEELGSFNKNNLIIIYYLIERFGAKTVFEAEFSQMYIYIHLASNDYKKIERIYLNLKLLNNVNEQIKYANNMIDYLEEGKERKEYEMELEKLKVERSIYLEAIKLICGIDNIS